MELVGNLGDAAGSARGRGLGGGVEGQRQAGLDEIGFQCPRQFPDGWGFLIASRRVVGLAPGRRVSAAESPCSIATARVTATRSARNSPNPLHQSGSGFSWAASFSAQRRTIAGSFW